MLCLAFDTATMRCTVAVGTRRGALAAIDVSAPRDHMARLLPLAQAALAQAGGLSVADLDAVVVGVGPGSLTGVRIGVATAKAIARASGLPLFGVPTLDAVAQGMPCGGGRIVVLADAARGEVYAMDYEWEGDALVRHGGLGSQDEPTGFVGLDARDAAQRIAARFDRSAPLLVGDALARHSALFADIVPQATVAPESHWYPRAEALIERAHVLASEQDGAPGSVLPIYTRLSDAEEAEALRARA